jgi:hypothetical protein
MYYERRKKNPAGEPSEAGAMDSVPVSGDPTVRALCVLMP